MRRAVIIIKKGVCFISKNSRTANEIAHGKKIKEQGEAIWNWSTPAGKLRFKRRGDLFRAFVGSDGKRVLEIGCGTGLLTQEIAVTDSQITAIDISVDLIELAKKRVRRPHVQFVITDAHATDLESETFDCIVGSSCLHHLDVDRALREFYRLLKPGGRILFTEPNMLNPQIALQKNIPILKKWAMDSPDETAFFRKRILKTLTRLHFVDAAAVPFDFLHPSIPGVLLHWVNGPLLLLERVPLVKEIAGSLIISAAKP